MISGSYLFCSPPVFTAPCCYSNGAVMPSLGVCPSVCDVGDSWSHPLR